LGTEPVIDEAILAGTAGSTGATGSGTDWSWLQNVIGGAVNTAETILKNQNVVRGVLTQTSPGVYQYVQPAGSQVTLPIGASQVVSASASPGMGIVLVGGAALLLVFMLAKGKG
jgi:hypothetical protein